MTEASPGAGRGGIGTDRDTRGTRPAPAPRQSAAKVRKTIVNVLSPGKPMTPDEVAQGVALSLGSGAHPPIEQQLRVLIDSGDVTPIKGDARRMTLTDQGMRWSRGIRALSASHAESDRDDG